MTGNWEDFGPLDSEWKETTPEQILEDLERMQKELNELDVPDTALMDPEWFARLFFQQRIYEDEKAFWFYFAGYKLRVIVDVRVPVGKVLICRGRDVERFFEEKGADCSGRVAWKQEVKYTCCRVCGQRYESRAEAKQCQRSHEWQNRKGRR